MFDVANPSSLEAEPEVPVSHRAAGYHGAGWAATLGVGPSSPPQSLKMDMMFTHEHTLGPHDNIFMSPLFTCLPV